MRFPLFGEHGFLSSSVGRKQFVAATGLCLILFVVVHLAGNLLLFAGPDVFNAYAHKLASLRPALFVVEAGLLVIFVSHLAVTVLLVVENSKARGKTRYDVQRSQGERSLATRLMPWTGGIILAFVIWHLLDFTFTDPDGPRGVMPNEVHRGLYGVVFNSFLNPLNSLFYIVAMVAVGLHLSHGVQSFVQTFGFSGLAPSPKLKVACQGFGLLVGLVYSCIPIYVMVVNIITFKSGTPGP